MKAVALASYVALVAIMFGLGIAIGQQSRFSFITPSQFAAILTAASALWWPLVVSIGLVVFRRPIRQFLQRVESFDVFGVKAKLSRDTVRSQQNADQVAFIAATAAARIDRMVALLPKLVLAGP